MKVAIYSRGLEEGQEQHLQILLQELKAHKATVQLFSSLATPSLQPILQSYKPEIFDNEKQLDDSVDCLISLGGDGYHAGLRYFN
jgi:NAD+ kinase